ncbi:hypothetical protein [Solibacillus sp. FSL K6-1523]|uniref:hypothetical protein n=1 Tax=Solibacillus sp. FSL K6-1523 TaxID=2921471 RepID=UPI0030F91708
MSLFTMLVSDQPLKEVDLTGITEITVRELKFLNPITENSPEKIWHTMDDDALIIQAPDESAFNKLVISATETPPFDLRFYSKKEHVYFIGGNWRGEFLTDLSNYIKENIRAEHNVELLVFWADDEAHSLKQYTFKINEVQPSQLETIEQKRYSRAYFV